MSISDAMAVAQARAGDQDACRLLVDRHSRKLFRLAFRMTGNREDAEDVVQETFLRAFRQLGRFDERAQFGTWLYRIAANSAVDVERGRKRRNEQQPLDGEQAALPGPAPSPERLAYVNQLEGRVAEAMDRLSPVERTAFVLRHFEGMCVEEIGRTLGVQSGAARHSIFRAAQKLRRALEPLAGTAKCT